MKNHVNILLVPEHNTGQHFIDWSIYFLAKQDRHLVDLNSVSGLGSQSGRWMVNNLVKFRTDNESSRNFHHHKIFFADQTAIEFEDFINSIYRHNLPITTVHFGNTSVWKLTDYCRSVPDSGDLDLTEMSSKLKADFEKCSEILIKKSQVQDNVHLIQFEYDPIDYLNIFYNNRDPQAVGDIKVNTQEDMYASYEKKFFNNEGTKGKFGTGVWDQREKLAINIRHYISTPCSFSKFVDTKKPHHYYTTDDVWNDLPNVLKEILEFNNIVIDAERFATWMPVYWQWREKHDNHFSRNFNRILDAIVNDKYLDLHRFDLNFLKEVMIQYGLLEKYDLLIKGHGVESLPKNTQEIHRLLEKNFHKL